MKDDPDYAIAPPGYSPQKIAFKVVIKPDGELFEIQDARVADGGKPHSRQVMVPGGAKPTGSGLNPCFLWDNSGYMLGHKPEDPKPERTRASFEEFRKRHLSLEEEIGSSRFSSVCRFLEHWDPEGENDLSLFDEVGAGFGVFQILGEQGWVHEDERVTEWWDNQSSESGGEAIGQCLITGEEKPVAKTHPKLKGVRGAQSSGAALVSFNENAYESYGRGQSFNAPVSEDAAFRYSTALNALTDGPQRHKHILSLGDSTVLFWTDKPTAAEDLFARFASHGSAIAEAEEGQDEAVRQKVEVFLRALREGKPAYGDMGEDPDGTRFFILALSPNAARLSVRFFLSGTLGHLFDNLRKHYSDTGMDRREPSGKFKGDPEFLSSWTLLNQTAREAKEIPPILSGPLLRSIVTGAPYPDALYSAVIRRIHADRTVNYARASIIKGYLVRNRKQEISMSLDVNREDAAYRLGRLFAVLEKTQNDALGNISSTIRDRYYSSASATPRSVFPRLLRTYQHHLSKLEGGRKVNREKLVQEIIGALEEFPAHLNLADQGLFAIGYYHQNKDLFTKKNKEQAEEV